MFLVKFGTSDINNFPCSSSHSGITFMCMSEGLLPGARYVGILVTHSTLQRQIEEVKGSWSSQSTHRIWSQPGLRKILSLTQNKRNKAQTATKNI